MDMTALKAAIAAKAGIQLPTLMLVRQLDENQTPQPWLSHWENDARVRITFPEDVAKAVAAEPTIDKLAFKYSEVDAHGEVEAYKRFVVIIPSTVEMTF